MTRPYFRSAKILTRRKHVHEANFFLTERIRPVVLDPIYSAARQISDRRVNSKITCSHKAQWLNADVGTKMILL